ncbi:HEAT repeat domain-containing protein [Novipirellula artificiosorum]|uniref:HEAT repeat protein n=1 Tax=Novipirellula artificiosorum TaxID=2528016 RepID=A0A5C6DJS7_9BACT|nr:HEAT repeat domain-containing protein [Novipirellula artificiosorum]TWU35166.1 hypothetical protein Poly41_43150 [Novipirellula artificiosorum]
MQNDTDTLTSLLGPSADPVAAGWRLREIAEGGQHDGADLIAELCNQIGSPSSPGPLHNSDPAILGGLLHLIHTLMLRRAGETLGKSLHELNPQWIERLYPALPPLTPNRHLLLQLLAMIRSRESLSILMDLMIQSPPSKWLDAAFALSPLMQHADWQINWVFPKVMQCLQHPSLAAPVLDLGNYLVRARKVQPHPAAEQVAMLNHLLGEVSGRLGHFEANPRAFGDDVETVQATLGEAVALAVSLCDALGLIGDASSIGKLNQTIELKHRRVQCEAAGALAMLGDDMGKKRLLELTADPAARLRAIQYADELGLGESVEPEMRLEAATAEAEMSLWLTQPQQMGVPPTGVEVIETRRMMWPSFTERMDVHLVRFEYNFGDKQYSNVGITGPVVFAMSADVADLPVDDIYAIYAGWHAEHEEIFAVPASQFNEAQHRAMGLYVKHLDQLGYEEIKPELLGFFLDEQAGVLSAKRDGTECVVVTDALETIDQPIAGRVRPLRPGDLFNLYKGRKMLRTFNPPSNIE